MKIGGTFRKSKGKLCRETGLFNRSEPGYEYIRILQGVPQYGCKSIFHRCQRNRTHSAAMKAPALWAAIGAILIFSGAVNAWGGLFNRFSPEMLANMGYGSHGGAYRPQAFLQNEILDEDQQNQRIEDDACFGKPCYSNENCCPGLVCVNVDGVIGHCMIVMGRKYGELCRRDSDCESGLVCDISTLSGASVCRPPMVLAKQYAEDCITSSDCDITRGLCCQVQRRHRQVPRKVCSYFKDPLLCIGTVAADQVKHEIEHTAGEKRIIYNKH